MLGLIISSIHVSSSLQSQPVVSAAGGGPQSQPRHSATPTGSLPSGTPWLIRPLPPCLPVQALA